MEHEQGIDSFISKRTNPEPAENTDDKDYVYRWDGKKRDKDGNKIRDRIHVSENDAYQKKHFGDSETKTSITGVGMKASDFKMKLKTPGAIIGILGIIILIVFAIAPAYKDAPYSRLGLLMRVILTGGTIKDKEDSTGVQAVTGGVYANGQEGGDLYAPINVWSSGSYSSH